MQEQFKLYLATAKGGAVLTKEIVAVEPLLCKDNRWRVEAITRAGARIELDTEHVEYEQCRVACAFIAKTLAESQWRL
jgi:hypothetical protein